MSGWASKQKKKAAFAEEAALDGGYDGGDAAAKQLARDVRGAAMGQGDEELFEKKMSKEEKKAAAKAAREAKKAAKAAKSGKPIKAQKAVELTAAELAAQADEAALAVSAHGKQEAAIEALSRDHILVTYAEDKNKLMNESTRDINVSDVTVLFHGKPLIEDTELVINYGNRYVVATPPRGKPPPPTLPVD